MEICHISCLWTTVFCCRLLPLLVYYLSLDIGIFLQIVTSLGVLLVFGHWDIVADCYLSWCITCLWTLGYCCRLLPLLVYYLSLDIGILLQIVTSLGVLLVFGHWDIAADCYLAWCITCLWTLGYCCRLLPLLVYYLSLDIGILLQIVTSLGVLLVFGYWDIVTSLGVLLVFGHWDIAADCYLSWCITCLVLCFHVKPSLPVTKLTCIVSSVISHSYESSQSTCLLFLSRWLGDSARLQGGRQVFQPGLPRWSLPGLLQSRPDARYRHRRLAQLSNCCRGMLCRLRASVCSLSALDESDDHPASDPFA